MSTPFTIQAKRSTGSSAPSSLSAGEIAWSDGTKTFYVGNAVSGTVTSVGGSGYISSLLQSNNGVYATDTGSANAYAIAPSPAVASYTAGQMFMFKVANTNTGASTLNVNSLGTQAIKKGVSSALSGGELLAGQVVHVQYDGTNFQIVSAYTTGSTASSLLYTSSTTGGISNSSNLTYDVANNYLHANAMGNLGSFNSQWIGMAYDSGTTATSGTVYCGLVELAISNASSSSATLGGLNTEVLVNSANAQNITGTIVGIDNITRHAGTGTVSNAIGVRGGLTVNGSTGCTVTEGTSIYATAPTIGGSGAITNWYGLRADQPTTSGYSGLFIGQGTTTTNVLMTDNNYNVVVGSAALSTSATDGFPYIPNCAGAPSGTPTSYTGRSPLVVDTTDNILYFYNSGWVSATSPTVDPSLCQGRLYGTSGTPCGDTTSITSLLFGPSSGNLISIYNGTTWATISFVETSISLSGLASGNCYDIFATNNSGTIAFDSPLAWTNATTRATNIVLQNGVYVKSGATSHRYIGTIYTSSTGTTIDNYLFRYVYNGNRNSRVAKGMTNAKAASDTTLVNTTSYAAVDATNLMLAYCDGMGDTTVSFRCVNPMYVNSGATVGSTGLSFSQTAVNSSTHSTTVNSTFGATVTCDYEYFSNNVGLNQMYQIWSPNTTSGTIHSYGQSGGDQKATIQGTVFA